MQQTDQEKQSRYPLHFIDYLAGLNLTGLISEGGDKGDSPLNGHEY